MSEFVVGMDIGYSNLKIALGEKGGEPETIVRPVGAGPVSLLPNTFSGDSSEGLIVNIDGEKWAVGVEPERLQGWERELHEDYPSTNAYKALFYATLLLSSREVIDTLVTGLPVSHHLDQEKREELINRLKGEHKITPKRTVTVNNVVVVPQPVGAYMNVFSGTDDAELLEIMQEGRTVIVDPGFFSVDWVSLEEGEIRNHSSGTSLKAMSVLLEEANRLIIEEHGGGPGYQKIERALRAGKDDIFLFGQRVELGEYLKRAGENTSSVALTSMRKTMREDGMNADIVILAGGGATSYEAAARELFPRSRVVLTKNPVLANALGFWHWG